MIYAFFVLSVAITVKLVLLVKKFNEKYKVGLYYMDRDEPYEQEENSVGLDYRNSMDLRGNPTHECICGCNIFNVKAIFDNFEIATYFLDMECAQCGSVATAPTPLDRENTE
jgi:hypothetical protein